jgi:hypothetical protein
MMVTTNLSRDCTKEHPAVLVRQPKVQNTPISLPLSLTSQKEQWAKQSAFYPTSNLILVTKFSPPVQYWGCHPQFVHANSEDCHMQKVDHVLQWSALQSPPPSLRLNSATQGPRCTTFTSCIVMLPQDCCWQLHGLLASCGVRGLTLIWPFAWANCRFFRILFLRCPSLSTTRCTAFVSLDSTASHDTSFSRTAAT